MSSVNNENMVTYKIKSANFTGKKVVDARFQISSNFPSSHFGQKLESLPKDTLLVTAQQVFRAGC